MPQRPYFSTGELEVARAFGDLGEATVGGVYQRCQ